MNNQSQSFSTYGKCGIYYDSFIVYNWLSSIQWLVPGSYVE